MLLLWTILPEPAIRVGCHLDVGFHPLSHIAPKVEVNHEIKFLIQSKFAWKAQI